METVVANAANVDLKKYLVNDEQQLRRLRELILRLKIHKKRRSPTRARDHSPCSPPSCQLGSPGPPEHRVQYLRQLDQHEPLVLEEVELLDLEVIGFSDHETWWVCTCCLNYIQTNFTCFLNQFVLLLFVHLETNVTPPCVNPRIQAVPAEKLIGINNCMIMKSVLELECVMSEVGNDIHLLVSKNYLFTPNSSLLVCLCQWHSRVCLDIYSCCFKYI